LKQRAGSERLLFHKYNRRTGPLSRPNLVE
jgi:hypothetical protein